VISYELSIGEDSTSTSIIYTDTTSVWIDNPKKVLAIEEKRIFVTG